MTPKNARLNAAQQAKRGQEALAEAKHLLEGSFFNGAITRAYYAAYHFARALLFLKGLEPKTHRGVIRLLSLHFVKPGILEDSVADHLPRLETFRELSDYDAAVQFTRNEAEVKIQQAEVFIAECRKILRTQRVQL